MKKYFYSLFLLIFISATHMTNFSQSEIEVNQVISDFKKEMKKKGISLVGTGGSEKEGKCSLIHLQFEVDEELTLYNGRKLAVDCTENFLLLLNSKKGIENYLIEYPFTYKKMVISLFGKRFSSNDAVFDIVSASQGEIRYSIIVPGKPLKLMCKENFEESKVILRD